jgi:hypothetical protein
MSAYAEWGITGVVVFLFIMMIVNLMKSQKSQNEDLDDIRVHISKIEQTSKNVEGIVIKLIDRIGRQEDTSTRHREDIVKELNDLGDEIQFIKGVISRLNGQG